ncbi:unnamed protein product [Urochloa decumbens]|uniref:Uncharacterized protein n=1 Tax=Urochloa decumbens TaxID=240449 RepID=A0ABC8VA24_9POAL
MESRRHHQRSRGPPRPPHHHQQQQPHHPRHRQNPNILISPAAASSYAFHQRHSMDEDAISTLMDIDESPSGAGFLDEEDGEGEMFLTHRGGRGGGGEFRGPLPFSGFYNKFDGADFDDADLA